MRVHLLSRFLALFLALCLGLPSSSLALRPVQPETPQQREGLTGALKDGEPVLPVGLEESAIIAQLVQAGQIEEAAKRLERSLKGLSFEERRGFLGTLELYVRGRLQRGQSILQPTAPWQAWGPATAQLLAALEPEAFDVVIQSCALRDDWIKGALQSLRAEDREVAEAIGRKAIRWLAPQFHGRNVWEMLSPTALPELERIRLLGQRGDPPVPLVVSLLQLLELQEKYGRLAEPVLLRENPVFVVGDHDVADPLIREAQLEGRLPRNGIILVNWDWLSHDDGAAVPPIEAFDRELKDSNLLKELQGLADSPSRKDRWEIRARWLSVGDFLKGVAVDGSATDLIHVIPPIHGISSTEAMEVAHVQDRQQRITIHRVFPDQLPALLEKLQAKGRLVETVDLDHFLFVPRKEQAVNAEALEAFARAQQEMARQGIEPNLRIIALSSPEYVPAPVVPSLLPEVLNRVPPRPTPTREAESTIRIPGLEEIQLGAPRPLVAGSTAAEVVPVSIQREGRQPSGRAVILNPKEMIQRQIVNPEVTSGRWNWESIRAKPPAEQPGQPLARIVADPTSLDPSYSPPQGQLCLAMHSFQTNFWEPQGFLIADGHLVAIPGVTWSREPWVFVLDAENPGLRQLPLADGLPQLAGARDAIVGPVLVRGGVNVSGEITQYDPSSPDPNQVRWEPRTTAAAFSAIGRTADGRLIALSLRTLQTLLEQGMKQATVQDMAQAMIALGAVEAMLLGGSMDVQQWIAGETQPGILGHHNMAPYPTGRPLNAVWLVYRSAAPAATATGVEEVSPMIRQLLAPLQRVFGEISGHFAREMVEPEMVFLRIGFRADDASSVPSVKKEGADPWLDLLPIGEGNFVRVGLRLIRPESGSPSVQVVLRQFALGDPHASKLLAKTYEHRICELLAQVPGRWDPPIDPAEAYSRDSTQSRIHVWTPPPGASVQAGLEEPVEEMTPAAATQKAGQASPSSGAGLEEFDLRSIDEPEIRGRATKAMIAGYLYLYAAGKAAPLALRIMGSSGSIRNRENAGLLDDVLFNTGQQTLDGLIDAVNKDAGSIIRGKYYEAPFVIAEDLGKGADYARALRRVAEMLEIDPNTLDLGDYTGGAGLEEGVELTDGPFLPDQAARHLAQTASMFVYNPVTYQIRVIGVEGEKVIQIVKAEEESKAQQAPLPKTVVVDAPREPAEPAWKRPSQAWVDQLKAAMPAKKSGGPLGEWFVTQKQITPKKRGKGPAKGELQVIVTLEPFDPHRIVKNPPAPREGETVENFLIRLIQMFGAVVKHEGARGLAFVVPGILDEPTQFSFLNTPDVWALVLLQELGRSSARKLRSLPAGEHVSQVRTVFWQGGRFVSVSFKPESLSREMKRKARIVQEIAARIALKYREADNEDFQGVIVDYLLSDRDYRTVLGVEGLKRTAPSTVPDDDTANRILQEADQMKKDAGLEEVEAARARVQ